MEDKLDKIKQFKYSEHTENNDLKVLSSKKNVNRSIKSPRINKQSKGKQRTQRTTNINTDVMPNLNSSLSDGLHIVFIGFNPGFESSRTQHHYAHHSNLFWKLFNQSKVLIHIQDITKCGDPLQLIDNHKNTYATPENDFDLAQYGIGFSDLVLRCTKQAQELTMAEKLENVPRLLQEITTYKPEKVVIIGKGIWEIIVKYIQKKGVIDKGHKYTWGRQNNTYCHWVRQACNYEFDLHVFPSTSGLVAGISYQEKLRLWNQLFH